MNTRRPTPDAVYSLPRDRLDQQLDAVIERAEPRLDTHEQERRHRHREPDIANGRKNFLHVSHLLGMRHAGTRRRHNQTDRSYLPPSGTAPKQFLLQEPLIHSAPCLCVSTLSSRPRQSSAQNAMERFGCYASSLSSREIQRIYANSGHLI